MGDATCEVLVGCVGVESGKKELWVEGFGGKEERCFWTAGKMRMSWG